MKKNYFFAVAASFILSASVVAQSNIQSDEMPVFRTPASMPKKNISSDKVNANFYLDYDYADEALGTDYKRFIWWLNTKDSTGGNGDVTLFNALVAFDTIVDCYNLGPTYVPGVDYASIRVDSIFAVVGHSNISGNNDTIRFKIISLSANGYPQPNNVLYSDIIVTNTGLSANNDWLQSFVAFVTPGFILSSTQRWGVLLEYLGAVADTFGIVAGFDNLGSSGQCTYTARTTFFKKSPQKANTFTTWWKYKNYGTLPTSGGANIYYDCNGSGSKDAGDSETYMQNLSIWTNVTTDPAGIKETELLSNISVYPNPAKNYATLQYSVNENSEIVINITDITGKIIKSIRQHVAAGTYQHALDLTTIQEGIYFYSIYANDKLQITKKFSVIK